MAISGMLQPDKVVWYHPFDTWADSAGHTWAPGYGQWASGTMGLSAGGKLGNYAINSGGAGSWASAGVEVGGISLGGEARVTVAAWVNWPVLFGGTQPFGSATIGCGPDQSGGFHGGAQTVIIASQNLLHFTSLI